MHIDPKYKAELNMVVLEHHAHLRRIQDQLRAGVAGDIIATALSTEATRVKDKVKAIVQSEDERMMACFYVGAEVWGRLR